MLVMLVIALRKGRSERTPFYLFAIRGASMFVPGPRSRTGR